MHKGLKSPLSPTTRALIAPPPAVLTDAVRGKAEDVTGGGAAMRALVSFAAGLDWIAAGLRQGIGALISSPVPLREKGGDAMRAFDMPRRTLSQAGIPLSALDSPPAPTTEPLPRLVDSDAAQPGSNLDGWRISHRCDVGRLDEWQTSPGNLTKATEMVDLALQGKMSAKAGRRAFEVGVVCLRHPWCPWALARLWCWLRRPFRRGRG